ncbi:MAG: TlpA family protein disulfide reductase [Verrucomicrobiaceae bacterium]|nr:MAG: TlpA family protein disulfide reductase [Verrucomicrobiaceae bacterium]
MRNLSRLLAAALLLLAAESPASPAEAGRIQKSWQLAMENWSLETRAATTPEARAAAIAKRPDSLPYVRDMWAQIGPALDQAWVLEPAAWFLRVAPGLRTTQADGSSAPAFAVETDAVLKALETRHLKSPGMIPVCMALTGLRDPRALGLLEKIQASHPEVKTQGVAALATALVLKNLGDDPELMRKRLTCLRKAIIDSSDIDLGGVTVSKVAEDELYVIRYLTKGRVAPDLSGMDSASRPLKLSDFAGRVIVLLFWNSAMPEADRVIEITAEMERKFQGKPLTVVGVNHDPLEKLRSLEAEGIITWRNFSDPGNQLAREYRVAGWPLAYVLDGERKIHYAGAPGSFVELTAEALLPETGTAPGE